MPVTQRAPVTTTTDRLLIQGVTWKSYVTLADELNENHVRLTYDRGRLEIMSPTPRHEIYKRWMSIFLGILATELKVQFKGCGSATFKREDLARGLEPDECFYFTNASLVHDWADIDLSRDPPPDLAVEIDVTSSSIDRMEVYAALGVKEVWRFDTETLQFYRLGPDERYAIVATSAYFPLLVPTDLVTFLHESVACPDDGKLMNEFRDWVQQQLTSKKSTPSHQ
jgi:Uma2 family endonuclease